jgi:hypothetical protein
MEFNGGKKENVRLWSVRCKTVLKANVRFVAKPAA